MRSGRGGMRAGAGRKSPWQSGETQTIRVPVAIKEELLSLGQQLDQGRGVIGGGLRRQLEQLLEDWESQCGEQSEGEWLLVQQLLGEIRDLMNQTACGHSGHGDRHQRQFRHRGHGQRLGCRQQDVPLGEMVEQTIEVEGPQPKEK
ncbi:hypothetical protein IQ225_05870 [Synechocystis salina LEGE 06155]|nr:hypothetical protein [Synechocystis salina LEGE 06155]